MHAIPHHVESSGRAGSRFRIEFASDIEEFAGLWPTARNRQGGRFFPFQCAEVLRTWTSTIGASRGLTPVFVVCRLRDGRPALALPLVIERSMGFDVLRFMDCDVSDYNAPVVFPDAVGQGIDSPALWEELVAALPPFDIAVLEKMPEFVEDALNPLAALSTAAHPECGHAVTLAAPWEEFARARLPNWRDSRRCLRNLEKHGSVSFEIAQTRGKRAEFLDALFRQKRRRFAETGATDIFSEPGVGEFYVQSTSRAGECGTLVSGLKLDGRLLAVNWGFVAGDRYYDLITANEGGEFRSYAPGRLLNEWLLSWCIDNGIKVSDFGIGDESYKFGYCDLHIPLRDAHIPVTSRGSLYCKLLRTQKMAKQMLRDTQVGTALKAARNHLYRIVPGRPSTTCNSLAPWIAAIGTATIAIDA